MRVKILPSALRDIGSVYKWLSARSVAGAEHVESSIFEAIDFLGENPGFGSATDERNIRRWALADYRYTIFFRVRVDKNFMEILRVVHSRRVRNLRRIPK